MTEGLSAVVGLFAPMAIQLLNQHVESKLYKQLIAVGICSAFGALVTVLTGEFDAANLMASVGICYTTANVAYKQYFQNL